MGNERSYFPARPRFRVTERVLPLPSNQPFVEKQMTEMDMAKCASFNDRIGASDAFGVGARCPPP